MMKWSIRLKFFLVMSGLLTACLSVYLLMAMTVFKSDKTQLVFDLNRSQVSNLASEVETGLSGVSEKLKFFAQLPITLQNKMVDDLLSEDSELVSVAIYKGGTDRPIRTFAQPQFLSTYGLSSEVFNDIQKTVAIPFTTILKDGEDIWNASTPGTPPLIGFGRLVVVQDDNGVPVDQWTVVGYLKIDRFMKSVSIVSLSEIVIANRHGEILVQRDAKTLASRPNIQNETLFKDALASKVRLSVSNVETAKGRSLAAFAKTFNSQIVVIAKAPESEVFKVVQNFGVRTLLFGSVVLTLVILAAFMLSRSLTRNIALLAKRMEAVSKGDLSTEIHLTGRDETKTLGLTFNQMIHDLQQSRDELETINRELDQKVKERTLQLEEQNRKVQEAQEALLRTTRLASVGEIAGRTAHEVLNPLTSLLTRAGLMQQRATTDYQNQLSLLEEITSAWKNDFTSGGLDNLNKVWAAPSDIDPTKTLLEEDLENLETVTKDLSAQNKNLHADTEFIRKEGERIGKIINSMRRLGHLKSDIQSVSLHAVLSDCCHIMADLFAQKHFVIEKDFKAQHDMVLADRDELIQSITNLMRNSLQALEDAAKTHNSREPLKMRVRTFIKGNEIRVHIEDNGVGIKSEHQEQLFNSSFTTKSPETGTGLGLGISRRFLRNCGGDIEFVSSTPGRETVFCIRIPLDTQHQGAVA